MLSQTGPKVLQLAQAIAKAEGFGPPQNLPTRINNPCDLELGNKGFGVQGGKTIFGPLQPDPDWEKGLANGWAAGCHEAYLMLTGESHYYNPIKTFLQVAILYTGSDNAMAWATTVSGTLGLKPQNTLQDFLNL